MEEGTSHLEGSYDLRLDWKGCSYSCKVLGFACFAGSCCWKDLTGKDWFIFHWFSWFKVKEDNPINYLIKDTITIAMDNSFPTVKTSIGGNYYSYSTWH